MSLTHKHNRHFFLTLTNHKIVCFGFMAYHINVQVILALHRKMAPSPKLPWQKQLELEPPLWAVITRLSLQGYAIKLILVLILILILVAGSDTGSDTDLFIWTINNR